jgi:hypothetical protein
MFYMGTTTVSAPLRVEIEPGLDGLGVLGFRDLRYRGTN